MLKSFPARLALWLGLLTALLQLPAPPAALRHALASPPASSPAEGGSVDAGRQLLEMSLRIAEIDKELDRAQESRLKLQQRIADSEEELELQEERLQERKQQAGRSLASYYMGKQEKLLGALLHVRSLGDLMRALDLIDLVLRGDRALIAEYGERSARLREDLDQLDQERAKLAALELQLTQRRGQLDGLRQQLELRIAESDDPEQARSRIESVQQLWETEGRDKLRSYFKALAKAMNQLPDWLKEHPEHLKLDAGGYALTLPDDTLNRFLQEQDPALASFRFVFENGQVAASGSEGQLKLEATGRYEVVEKPKNGIRFRIGGLRFNGLELPQSTIEELEQSFNLGFYPGKLISFVRIDSVQIEAHELRLRFKFSL
ncbi:hypothetical protein HGI30_13740 [Paenibacillus albicereus]|uniref:Uncharacterized protein n=1 Tax=Paenibacillus albicereus TaxID=2726185 RepID=A0A6H2GYM7_9BACL|nr:hypothetical protein [Paenibacillus albicereus]QJC52520.1 hypothetical protein HGI30_13740 [Paenibacillus albicereus]